MVGSPDPVRRMAEEIGWSSRLVLPCDKCAHPVLDHDGLVWLDEEGWHIHHITWGQQCRRARDIHRLSQVWFDVSKIRTLDDLYLRGQHMSNKPSLGDVWDWEVWDDFSQRLMRFGASVEQDAPPEPAVDDLDEAELYADWMTSDAGLGTNPSLRSELARAIRDLNLSDKSTC